MKASLFISSLLVACTFGEVISTGYSTYLRTPEALTEMARSDDGFAYSVTSAHNQPGSFLYGLQQIGRPLALTYGALGVTPLRYISRDVLPYDIYNKHVLQKVVVPYSTLSLSPLISQLSAIYQTSSIPDKTVTDEQRKLDSLQFPLVANRKPLFSQNPFLAHFLNNNKVVPEVPRQDVNSISSVEPVAQGNNVGDHDTVAIESA